MGVNIRNYLIFIFVFVALSSLVCGIDFVEHEIANSGNITGADNQQDSNKEGAHEKTYFGGFTSRRISSNNYMNDFYFNAAIDIDSDGDLDVLSENMRDNKLVWYENQGNNLFTERIISYNHKSAVPADIDKDGDLDVLSFRWDKGAYWYENNGLGIFTEHTISAFLDATDLFAADLDSDGDLDIASSSWGQGIKWYENNGNEAFTERQINSTIAFASLILVADLDSDGDKDIVSSSATSNNTFWYENKGSKIFAEHQIISSATLSYEFFAVDLDSDKDMDLLSAYPKEYKVSWYENNGNEIFTEHIINSESGYATDVFAVDLDKDGDTDVLSTGLTPNNLSWYENNGNEVFVRHSVAESSGSSYRGPKSQTVTALDFDLDGDIDVLSENFENEGLLWYENDGNEKFTPRIIMDYEDGDRNTFPVDMSNDRDLDFISSSGRQIKWYENMGDNSFITRLITQRSANLSSVFAADIDKDGDIDIIAGGESLVWYKNNGNEIFSKQPVSNSYADAIFVIDLDKDNDLDILSASHNYSRILWHKNNGNQIFTEHLLSSSGVNQLLAIDLDKDGDLDIVSGDKYANKTRWYENNGNQTFAEHLVSSKAGANVFAVDLDKDNDLDIICTNEELGGMYFYENDGKQAFMEYLLSTSKQKALFPIDMDGDNNIDILSTLLEFNNYPLLWHENEGNEVFTDSHIISSSAYGTSQIFARDMDSDTDIDVISSGSGVYWHENHNFVAQGVGNTETPYWISAADVDLDGDTDMFSNSVWYENNGRQVFIPHSIPSTVSYRLTAEDIDKDGDIDLIPHYEGSSASQYPTINVAWYENNGDGRFSEHIIRTSGIDVFRAFDLDKDGDTDFLSATYSSNKTAWYENNGNQDFTEHIISTTAYEVKGTVAADIDNDGDFDIISGGKHYLPEEYYYGKIYLYENNGNQEFTEHIINISVGRIDGVFAHDIDLDGYTDLLYYMSGWHGARWYSGSGWLKNQGNMNFTVKTGVTSSPSWDNMIDFDRDGDLDAFAISGSPSRVEYYENDGTGNFIKHVSQAECMSSVTDLDSDGDIDFICPELWSENKGNLEFISHQTITKLPYLYGMSIADMDLDNDIDIISSSDDIYGLGLVFHKNEGNNRFFTPDIINPESQGTIHTTDIDNDGDTDILTNTGTLYENKGNNEFTESKTAIWGSPLFSIDMDKDGDTDILSAYYYSFYFYDPNEGQSKKIELHNVKWYEKRGNEFIEHNISAPQYKVKGVFAADMDKDGDIDVLSAYDDNTTRWHENNGNQEFTEHIISNSVGLKGIFALDLDKDGDIDVIPVSYNRYRIDSTYTNYLIEWYENDGSMNFKARNISTARRLDNSESRVLNDLLASDIDNDGDIDIISSEYNSYQYNHDPRGLMLYENNGEENFTEYRIALSSPSVISALDVDKDRDIDIFAGSNGGIVLYENKLVNSQSKNDLSITSSDISFTKTPQGVTVSASIFNLGSASVDQFEVELIEFSEGAKVKNELITINEMAPVSTQKIILPWNIASGSTLKVIIDPDNKIPESDKTNNFAEKTYIELKKAYLELNTGLSKINTEIADFIKQNAQFLEITNDPSQADVIIKAIRSSPSFDPLLVWHAPLMAQDGWGYIGSSVKKQNKLVNAPYGSVIGSMDYNGKHYIYIIGNDIDGFITGAKEFIPHQNPLIQGRASFLVNETNEAAIAVYDFLHTQNNAQYYKQDISAFASLAKRALNNQMTKQQELSADTENGITLRLRRILPEFSENFISYKDQLKLPVVLSRGVWSTINDWQPFGVELANDYARDTWLIEITGGPYTECPDCPDYTFNELTDSYVPALLSKVLAETGSSKLQYIGFSNGCRAALSALEKGTFSPDNVETFVGVACPGAFEGFDTTSSLIRLADTDAAIKRMESSGKTHFSIKETVASLLLAPKTSASESSTISLNLIKDYVIWINSGADTQPGENLALDNFAIIQGTGFVTSDGIVTTADEKATYDNIILNSPSSGTNKKSYMTMQGFHMPLLIIESMANTDIVKSLAAKTVNKQELEFYERTFNLKETQSKPGKPTITPEQRSKALLELLDSYDFDYSDSQLSIINLTSYGEDTDSNGLYNNLTIQLSVTANKAGNYTFIGDLYSNNELITSYQAEQYLSQGANTIKLYFEPKLLTSSAYTLSLNIIQNSLTIYRNNSLYSFSFDTIQYEKPDVSIAQQSYTIPDDKTLRINIPINASHAGDYEITAYLKGDEETVASTGTYSLAAGQNSIAIDFNGSDLRAKRLSNGILYLITIKDNTTMYEFSCEYPLTYDLNSFEPGKSMLTESYGETAPDSDSNGLKDYLRIDISVDITEAGTYTLKTQIYNIYGEVVKEIEKTTALNPGIQDITLHIDGAELYKSKINGPYILSSVQLLKDSIVLDQLNDAYVTDLYAYNDFEKPPMPDLKLSEDDISLSTANNASDIIITVRNTGAEDAYAASFSIYDNNYSLKEEMLLSQIGQGASEEITLNNISTPEGSSLYFVLDLNNLLEESNESNNQLTLNFKSSDTLTEDNTTGPGNTSTVKGDLNNDNTTDIFDVQLCINQALGLVPSTQDADVNNDSSVDVFDVQTIINIALGLYTGKVCIGATCTESKDANQIFSILSGSSSGKVCIGKCLECKNRDCKGHVECTNSEDCGKDRFTGRPYCFKSDIYQLYKEYTCDNPGTFSSSCSSEETIRLKQDCASNEVCMDSRCIAISSDNNKAAETQNNSAQTNTQQNTNTQTNTQQSTQQNTNTNTQTNNQDTTADANSQDTQTNTPQDTSTNTPTNTNTQQSTDTNTQDSNANTQTDTNTQNPNTNTQTNTQQNNDTNTQTACTLKKLSCTQVYPFRLYAKDCSNICGTDKVLACTKIPHESNKGRYLHRGLCMKEWETECSTSPGCGAGKPAKEINCESVC